VIAGILFDIQGGYSTIFMVFVVMALSCSLLVLKAKAPVKKPALPVS
jgi:cyanate permease